MKKNSLYALKSLCGSSFLVPYGQMMANYKKACELNETGVFIWNMLDKVNSYQELLDEVKAEYCWDDEVTKGHSAVVFDFLQKLSRMGIVGEELEVQTCGKAKKRMIKEEIENKLHYEIEAHLNEEIYLNIAGIEIATTLSISLLPDCFKQFQYTERGSQSLIGQKIAFVDEKSADDVFYHNSQHEFIPTIKTYDISIYEYLDGFEIQYHKTGFVKRVFITKDAYKAVVYVDSFDSHMANEKLSNELSAVLRIIFLNIALQTNMLAIHSASVLYMNRLILFSAPSGTGKTTQANLWGDLLKTPQINGDMNLVCVTSKGIKVCGTPWCGSSDICDANTYDLGFIAFLKQDELNEILDLDDASKAIRLLCRSFSPMWNAEMLDKSCSLAETIALQCGMAELKCRPDEGAVKVLKDLIDSKISFE